MKANTKRMIAAETSANGRREAEIATVGEGLTGAGVAAAARNHRHARHHRDSEFQRAELPLESIVQPAQGDPSRLNAPRGNRDSERLLTPRETAQFLRVSQSWLAKSRMRGDGPPYLLFGRSIRYGELALIRWIKSCVRQATSER